MSALKNKCIEETGKELVLNNHDIIKYLCGIEEERNTLDIIIQKQYQERKKIEAEIEKMTYKLCLINKSLSMRVKAKNNYDKTISEIKGQYERLVTSSNTLKNMVEKTQQELDDIMNKKIGTGPGSEGDEIRMLYVKPNENRDKDDCSCVYVTEVPTKDFNIPVKSSSAPSPRQPSDESQDNEFLDYHHESELQHTPTVQPSSDLRKQTSQIRSDTTSQSLNKILTSSSNNPLISSFRGIAKTRRSEEDVEVEMAMVTAEPETPTNSTMKQVDSLEPKIVRTHSDLSDKISIHSYEKTYEEAATTNEKRRQTLEISTNKELLRIAKSMTKMSAKNMSKQRVEIVNPQTYSRTQFYQSNPGSENNSSLSRSPADSTYDNSTKMQKRSVSDILKSASGLS